MGKNSTAKELLIFISHSSADTWVAKQIAREVEARGGTPFLDEAQYVWAEIGAAWGRRIPIVALLLGITPTELQTRAGIPVLLKKRDLLQLNEIDTYFEQLRARIAQNQG